MKQIITLFLTLLTFVAYSQSKEDAVQKPVADIRAGDAIEMRKVVGEDFDQQEVTPANWDNIAPSAKKLYSKEQILHFSPGKLDDVNFMCTRSFNILSVSNGCEFNINELDMNDINKSRELDKRVAIDIKQNGCLVKLELLTINELNSEYKKDKK
ncbi:MAG: hypothetical protein K0S44_386 [Bacteroidetes bacterium]|jgi:hypothetical protein|nr:hypothetical protein [Bacteroidota bacterium]